MPSPGSTTFPDNSVESDARTDMGGHILIQEFCMSVRGNDSRG